MTLVKFIRCFLWRHQPGNRHPDSPSGPHWLGGQQGVIGVPGQPSAVTSPRRMNHHELLSWSRRHLRWLLWFALLSPAAQVAAAAHVLSHSATAQHEGRGQDAANLTSCHLCPLAAAVSIGGAPSAVFTAPRVDVRHVLSDHRLPGRAGASLLRLFDSRAPPSLLH
jgi:hypothetical protein